MVALVISLVVLAASADEPAAPPDVAAYEAAASKLGRTADAHVKLALWCESQGLTAERLKHLAIAVMIDPRNTSARGLMGLVDFGGKWQRPDSVTEKVKADEALTASLAEYNRRRAHTPDSADAQWKLAQWCDQNGLTAEAFAHYTAVTRLDPARESAWKHLGYKKHAGRWTTDAQLAAEKAESEAQKKADKTWKPLLTKYRAKLADKHHREEVEAALRSVSDPRAVPSVWAVFANGRDSDQSLAVEIFGRIDAPAATRALGFLAVFSPSAEVRRAATESLKQRDPRDVVGWLIAMIRAPMKYEVRPVGGPGSPGALFIEGEEANVQRIYAPPSLPNNPISPGEPITYDGDGLPVITRVIGRSTTTGTSGHVDVSERISFKQFNGRAPVDPATRHLIQEIHKNGNPGTVVNAFGLPVLLQTSTTITTTTPQETTVQIPVGQIIRQYQISAAVAQQQLVQDVENIDRHNDQVKQLNERVGQALRGITGHDLGEDQQAWEAWWTDQQGYAYTPPQSLPKPTYVENVPLAYAPQSVPIAAPQTIATGPAVVNSTQTSSIANTVGHSCFKAATPVRTLTGPRPIEEIQAGDRVLTQNIVNGALSYQPVIAVFHNRPALTYAVGLGGETVSATGIHRFWKSGHGWVMARDLKPGDKIRTLNGPVEVKSVETESAVPVFNLEVASGQSFFVGATGLLVHDNSLVNPVTESFDAAPAFTAAR